MYLIKKRGYKRVAEVGVESGTLANRVLVNADVDIYYAVDPWKVYIESYDRPPKEHEKQQSYWDSLFERVCKIKERFPQLEIMRMPSVLAAVDLIQRGEVLDCVYVDAIHDGVNIVKDIYCWLSLVRDGGVISGHDYIKRFAGMCKALNQIFGDELKLMVVNPSRPALSTGNTFQGGNWWVEVKGYTWKVNLLLEIAIMFPEVIASVEEEWRSV